MDKANLRCGNGLQRHLSKGDFINFGIEERKDTVFAVSFFYT